MTTPDSGHLTIAPPSLMSANGPRQDLMRRQGSLSTRTAVGMMEKSKTEDFVVFFRSNHQLWTCTDLCIIFALSTECICVVSECNNSNKSLKNKIKRSISCPSWPWVWLKSNPANLPDTNELYVVLFFVCHLSKMLECQLDRKHSFRLLIVEVDSVWVACLKSSIGGLTATQSGVSAHTERKSQTSLLRLVSIPEGYLKVICLNTNGSQWYAAQVLLVIF